MDGSRYYDYVDGVETFSSEFTQIKPKNSKGNR